MKSALEIIHVLNGGRWPMVSRVRDDMNRDRPNVNRPRLRIVHRALEDTIVYMIFVTISSSAYQRVSDNPARGARARGCTPRGSGITHLHVLKAVLLPYAPQHILLAALLELAGKQELVEDEVGLLEVEDDVQLAHVAVVLVHLLDITVDNLEGYEFVVDGVAAGDEEEGGIAAVDDFGVWRNIVSLVCAVDPCQTRRATATDGQTFVLEEIAHARAAGEHELRDVFHDLGLFLGRERREPLGKALFSTVRLIH
jgi:hypothetical protein